MRSKMQNDRITEEADWRDGMNAFRLSCWRELKQLREQVKTLEHQLNGSSNEREESEAI